MKIDINIKTTYDDDDDDKYIKTKIKTYKDSIIKKKLFQTNKSGNCSVNQKRY